MTPLQKCLLLFVLNLADALLTIFWVRTGAATEGNTLMARLMEVGYAPFLLVKLSVGALVAYTLYRFSSLKLARRGLRFVLCLYLALMLVHTATGLSAAGWRAPERVLAYVSHLPDMLLALVS